MPAAATDALIEEAADVLEVVVAIVAERNVTFAGIVDAARHKRAETDGFGMRLWLDGVEPNPEG